MSDGGGDGMGAIPRYARPNLASKLPGNVGTDHEQIAAAFAPGSYKSIADLSDPRSSAAPSDHGALSVDPGVAFKSGCGVKKQFADFEYLASPYDSLADAKSRERQEHQQVVEKLHGDQPFIFPGSVSSAKYEGCYEYQSDPYDTVRDENLRAKWIEEKKILAGSFVPPGREKGLSRPTRAMLTDMMTHLLKILYDDWEEAKPWVVDTAEGLIVVYFNMQGMKSPTGLDAYMGVLVRRNPVVQRYNLTKFNAGWAHSTEDNHRMYTFRPPWVKTAPASFAAASAAAARARHNEQQQSDSASGKR